MSIIKVKARKCPGAKGPPPGLLALMAGYNVWSLQSPDGGLDSTLSVAAEAPATTTSLAPRAAPALPAATAAFWAAPASLPRETRPMGAEQKGSGLEPSRLTRLPALLGALHLQD